MLATHEIDSFAALSARERASAERWMSVIERVMSGRITKQHAAESMGCDLATIYRKLNAVKARGWQGLVPNWRGPNELADDFIEFWKTEVEGFQRNSKAAYRSLLRKWRAKEHIPGYAGHPGWPNLPAGWSYGNLMRHQPPRIARTAMRQGLGRAMADHGPRVFSTRAGLHLLARIQFDDVTHDNFVHLLDAKQLCRVEELGALDVLSGCRFAWGSRPQTMKNGVQDSLKEADMRFFLAHVLSEWGYSSLGTELIVERGTATIRERVINLLHDRTRGKIATRKGGMTGREQAIAGIGEGRGKGNPRHKAALESLHNLIHNELAALPAQTGKSKEDRPEWLHGVLEESADWLAIADELPPHLRAQLMLPTMEYYSQFVPALREIYKIINGRTEHELEGWAACGFMSADYRFNERSDQWISAGEFLALPSSVQQALTIEARANAALCRPRRLSPSEVFDAKLREGRERGEIIKPPVGLIAEILYEDLATPRRVDGSYFEFQDKTIAPEMMRFESRITTPDGHEIELVDRETYEVIVNPYQPKHLWIFGGTKKRGGFMGIARAVERFTQNDYERARDELGRRNKRTSELLAPVRRRHSQRVTEATARRIAHNNTLIERSRGILTGDAARAAAEASREGIGELIETDPEIESARGAGPEVLAAEECITAEVVISGDDEDGTDDDLEALL